MSTTPEPMLLNCPRCSGAHLDAESHCGSPGVTHLCDRCGWRWAPKETPTVGVTFEQLEVHLRHRITELERDLGRAVALGNDMLTRAQARRLVNTSMSRVGHSELHTKYADALIDEVLNG